MPNLFDDIRFFSLTGVGILRNFYFGLFSMPMTKMLLMKYVSQLRYNATPGLNITHGDTAIYPVNILNKYLNYNIFTNATNLGQLTYLSKPNPIRKQHFDL